MLAQIKQVFLALLISSLVIILPITYKYHSQYSQRSRTIILPSRRFDQVFPTALKSLPKLNSPVTNSSINNPKHWKPDWSLAENATEVLRQRKKGIMDRCKQLSPYKTPWVGHPHTLIVRGRSLSICTTAKGGSTYWKSLLRFYRSPNVPISTKLSKMTFVVTRNPWHRLVSVWNDKIVTHTVRKFWMRVMCRGMKWPTHPTFSEFIEHCVIKNWMSGRHFNTHWLPVIDRCKICSPKTHMGIFIAAENMNQEAAHLLQTYGGVADPRPLMATAKKKSARIIEIRNDTKTYQTQYVNVSEKHISILREMYKYEIFLFQYPDTPFVDFERS